MIFGLFGTLVAICFILACYGGPTSLSDDVSLLKATYWSIGTFDTSNVNSTIPKRVFTVYSNMHGVLFERVSGPALPNGTCARNCFSGAMCSWEQVQSDCVDTHASVFRESKGRCAAENISFRTSVIIAVVTVVLKCTAIYRRMDADTDNGFEKCKGMITSILPMLTIGFGLLKFVGLCVVDLENLSAAPDVRLGPGFSTFATALGLNLFCFIMHLLMPVPEGNESCKGNEGSTSAAPHPASAMTTELV